LTLRSRRVALLTSALPFAEESEPEPDPLSDGDSDDLPSQAAKATTHGQLNGEPKDSVKDVDTLSGRGEIEDASDSDDDEQGDEYNVEAIRGHRFVKGQLLYQIKWQGYPESDNTEEPESNLLP